MPLKLSFLVDLKDYEKCIIGFDLGKYIIPVQKYKELMFLF